MMGASDSQLKRPFSVANISKTTASSHLGGEKVGLKANSMICTSCTASTAAALPAWIELLPLLLLLLQLCFLTAI
jgi:hypothetical protein